MTTTNSIIADAELLLSTQGQPLNQDALNAVTAQPGVNMDERFSEAKKALLAVSPSAELDLLLAEDGTKLSDKQLEAVTAQPGVDKNALMQETRAQALAALKKVA